MDEVLEAFQALLDERAEVPTAGGAGHGNFRCERCEGCSHCRFCTDCIDCEDCTYCDGCSDCEGCTHCKECDRCSQTTHSTWSSACKDCSYVTLSLDCSGCVQCFACVGLRNEEFCILNEKLPRKTYFSRVAELRTAFEARAAAGWRPPWMVDDAVQSEEEDDDEVGDEGEGEPELLAQREGDGPRAIEEEPAASVIVDDPGPADSSVALSLETLWANELDDAAPVMIERDSGSGPIVFKAPDLEPTVDIGEPLEASDDTRPRSTPWSFSDVRRGRGSSRQDPAEAEAEAEPTVIPEPPPFGAPEEDEPERPSTAAARRIPNDEMTPTRLPPSDSNHHRVSDGERPRHPSRQEPARPRATEPPRREPSRREPSGESPRSGDEPTRPRSRFRDESWRHRDREGPARDRYGWSAQTEGTPAIPGWRASEIGPQRERPARGRSDDRPRRSRRWDPESRRWEDPPEPEPSPPLRRDGAPQRSVPQRGMRADSGPERQPLPRWQSEERERETRPSIPRGEDDYGSRGWSGRESRSRSDPEQGAWTTAKTSESQAMEPEGAPPRRGRGARERRQRWSPETPLSEPERRRRESPTSLDRRRRETAASPSARPIEEPPRPVEEPPRPTREPPRSTREPPRSTREPPSASHEQADLLQRDLDEWLPYDDGRRSRLGPEEQTEPDAPVRRGAARAEISGAARAPGHSGSIEWPEDRRTSGSRPTPKSSLGLARRPERPRPPEPRERGALLRGRAPARPAGASPGPRQSDAPSLRQARRPARAREETTSKFRAAKQDVEPDPGTS